MQDHSRDPQVTHSLNMVVLRWNLVGVGGGLGGSSRWFRERVRELRIRKRDSYMNEKEEGRVKLRPT